MTDIAIRLLTENDVESALALSASCGWNQRAAEWRMMLQIAPSGAFTAATPDGIVGTAIGIDYGNFAWIAMMLVNPDYRSRGLGARLLEAAIGALPRDLPIRLDATPLGRPLYERYGFVLESSLTRHVRAAGESRRPVPSAPVRPLVESDLSAVMHADERISGAHRHGALRWAFGDAPHYAWIGTSAGGPPSRFALRRGRLRGYCLDAAAGCLITSARLWRTQRNPRLLLPLRQSPGVTAARWSSTCTTLMRCLSTGYVASRSSLSVHSIGCAVQASQQERAGLQDR
jgi:GNAT superfamily N-acetyltransferase